MNKKIKVNDSSTFRKNLANPFRNTPLEERLAKSDTIDMRDNYKFIYEGNGYCRIEAKDKNKKFKKL